MHPPPPLEEASWILDRPQAFQDRMLRDCPGLLLLSYVLIAEAKLYIHPEEAREGVSQ